MRIEAFLELIETHGADPARWPAERRAAALRLREASPAARAAWAEAAALDALLATAPAQDPARTAAVVDGALRRLRQERDAPRLWTRLWQEWRWLLGRPAGAGLAAMVLAGWVLGQEIAPPTPPGQAAIDLIFSDPIALFEDTP
jgi:hypothetical protein